MVLRDAFPESTTDLDSDDLSKLYTNVRPPELVRLEESSTGWALRKTFYEWTTIAGAHTPNFLSPIVVEVETPAPDEEPQAIQTRIAGADRYDTAAKLSEYTFLDGVAEVVYIVNGTSSADALGVAGAATRKSGPLILVPAQGSLPTKVAAELKRLNVKEVIFMGGLSAISEDMTKQVMAAVNS